MGLRKHFGRGVRPKGGEMNGQEREYADYLHKLQLAGKILQYIYEPFSLRLSMGCHYKPDFLIHWADNSELEVHEVKGHWEDDALVKIKVAAEKFPFRFKAVKKIRGGGWDIREVGDENLTAKK
jgi:hypothetical protein